MKTNDFKGLITTINDTHQVLQSKAIQSINQFLTLRNWLIGFHIVEYEQNGQDRAKYGSNLLKEVSANLKTKGLKGFGERNLRNCRQFYRLYPQIWQSVIAKLQPTEREVLFPTKVQTNEIQRIIEDNSTQLSPELLLSKLSYTHFIELMKIDDSLERLFYEVESIVNNWSVRELQRAINTALFFRTGLSTDKQGIINKIKNIEPENKADIIRNPYILEFLDIEEKTQFSETDLETAILNHLQAFLIELGTGFCFEARQQRITIDNINYKIDLVFYHRILKCHVIIDLKMGAYDHADAGQMQFYLGYYKDNIMMHNDNPPMGIILCAQRNETLVKYTATDDMFVSEYELKLPDKKVLENLIKKDLEL